MVECVLFVVVTLAWLCPRVYLPSVQPAGPVLSRHRLLHAGAPDWQAAAPRRHQEPPEVLLDGQRDERSHDARTLVFAGQQRRQQRQQPETLQIHSAAAEPASELHAQQLQDLLAWNSWVGIQAPPLKASLGLSGGYDGLYPLQLIILLQHRVTPTHTARWTHPASIPLSVWRICTESALRQPRGGQVLHSAG